MTDTLIDETQTNTPLAIAEGAHAGMPQGAFDISRRAFMMATVAGVAGVAGAATLALAGCAPEPEAETGGTESGEITVSPDQSGIAVLTVSEDQVVLSSDFEEQPASEVVREVARWQLPIGTLVFQASTETALVLLPTDIGQELRTVGLLNLETGAVQTLLERAVGADEGMIIYDARASETAVLWTECCLATHAWRVYVMPLNANRSQGTGGSEDGEEGGQADGGGGGGVPARLVDEGDADYDPPFLAISQSKAYWTVMPNPNGSASKEDSYLKTVRVTLTNTPSDTVSEASSETPPETTPAAEEGSSSPTASDAALLTDEPYTVYTSHGRMITNPLVSDGILTFVPRVDTDNVYYQLTALNTVGDIVKTINTLPQSMRVSDALYLNGSLTFGIERNYDYAGGLAWFGTYQSLPDGRWLRVSKMPAGAPVYLGDWLVVKSTLSAVGINALRGLYFAIDTLPDCIDYGDVLAGWGTQQRLVIYTSLPDRGGYGSGVTVLRVFELLSPTEPTG